MNEQELQQAFVQWLALKLGVQSELELKAKVLEMGEDGLKQAYQQFMQEVQQQQVAAKRLGGKLAYINQLNGNCPLGYESKMFKAGGKICKKCVKKAQDGVEVNTQSNPVNDFKKNNSVPTEKCGGRTKKLAKKCACGGFVKKSACGNKVEKNKCGKKLKKRC